MLLRKRKVYAGPVGQSKISCSFEQVVENERDAFQSGPSAQCKDMLIEQPFRSCCDPSHVEREAGKLFVECPDFVSWKYAQNSFSQSFNGVLHLVEYRSLQSQKIARHGKIQNLPSSVRQRFKSKGPAGKYRIKMRAAVSLHQNCCLLIGCEFAGFEPLNELEFIWLKRSKELQLAQWAADARNLSALRSCNVLLCGFRLDGRRHSAGFSSLCSELPAARNISSKVRFIADDGSVQHLFAHHRNWDRSRQCQKT